MKIIFLLIAILSTNLSNAHPGRTASDGCHYCRTNCETYGYTTGTRHSHNGETCDPKRGPVDPKQEQNTIKGETPSKPLKASFFKSYDRRHFNHWIDSDGDCRNRRAEILRDRSAIKVEYSVRKDGRQCAVAIGRWDDYYFPEVLTDASKVDIDHIVPLKHAWDAGAKDWTALQREIFANDPINLAITNRSYNRQKGAQTPLAWAPSQREYYCKYLNDWIKVKSKYGLRISEKIYAFREKAGCLPN